MRRVLALLALLLVAGGVLRGVQAADPSQRQSRDEQSYFTIAHNLAERGQYGSDEMTDPAHWVPGAPVMFALGLKLAPPVDGAPQWDAPVIYVEQAIVGTLAIAAAFWLAWGLGGPLVGLIAAAAVAFYPPLITATGDMLSEPLGALLVTLALGAVVWTLRRATYRWWELAGCGALLALTILTRADLALVPALAGLVVLVQLLRRPVAAGVSWARRAGRAVLAVMPMVLAALVFLVPWSAGASRVSYHFVPLSTGSASVFFMGTYLPGDGTLFGAKKALADETKRAFPKFRDLKYFQIKQRDIIITVARRRPGLSEDASLNAAAKQNLRDYAWGRPGAFAAMMARKAWRLWGSYSVGTNGRVHPLVRTYHLLLVGLGLLGVVLGLAFARGRRAGFLVVALAVLYVTAVNMVLVSEARHNLTLLPALAAAGAGGIAAGVRWLRARRSAEAGPGADAEAEAVADADAPTRVVPAGRPASA